MRAKTLGVLIFGAGVVISICAFAVEKADRFPVVMRFLAPAYVHAQRGVAKLNSSKTLLPGEDGFGEIAKLFFDTAARENSPEVIALLSIKGFTRQTAMIAFGENHAGEVVPVEVELSNGQNVQWDLKEIESQLDSLKGNRVFDYTLVFFAVGTVLEISGFVIERRGASHERLNQALQPTADRR